MQDLKALIVQADTRWEDPEANFAQLAKAVETSGKPGSVDLIVLPETFSTGFSMNSERLAEHMQGRTITWMRNLAKQQRAVVTGSTIIREGSKFHNRLLWITPDGSVLHYDKRHLIGLMGEDKAFSPGVERKVFQLGAWRICPQICYDLRFPVWCRNKDDYDLLLFVANWPTPRLSAWRALLIARAIENQSFVLGVNRVGSDAQSLQFGGSSMLIDPMGEVLLELGDRAQTIAATLSREKLVSVRERLPFLKDRDFFLIGD